LAILLSLVALAAVAQAAQDGWPPASLNPRLAAPITTWDEAVPLGNGLMGALLWGEKNVIRLSLDRGDLWDERPAIEKEWWKHRTWAQGGDWDAPYRGVTPTKLPAGRVEIALSPEQAVAQFELNLATAEGFAQFSDGRKLTAFFSAVEPVAMVRIPGPEPKALDLMPSGAKRPAGDAGPSSGGAVTRLGYPSAVPGSEGRAKWFVQEAAEGLKYCVCIESRRVDGDTLMAVAVTSTVDSPDPRTLARKRCSAALTEGYEAALARHAAWWRTFWSQSTVDLPEPEILRYYAFARYLYGAGSRRGAPPMPLQGVWTADNGGLPPWKGDYHNDLNTQMTYIAYQAAGNFDEGVCYLDFLSRLAPTFRAFARDFYGTPGLASPGVMSLAGQPLGGWGQYSLSPTMTAWNAHLYYLHWRYTADDEFLRTQAYPWSKEAGECLKALLQPDAQGILKLPKSSSPEIFDNSARAWLIPNSNYDLMCMKMQFLALAEMADALGKADEAKQWSDTAQGLGDYHVDPSGMLLVDEKTPLPYSHRHLSNLIGLYPFNLITCEGGPHDQQRIRASLDQWDKLGTSHWCGYSFAWMSCLRARVGQPEAAIRNLEIFVKAFLLRNGFHANGDQTRMNFSSMHYRPFTLEGNFAALQAVHEMLLQSWSPTPGRRDSEILRIFPAAPWRWHDASFADLRAEGGHRVSARRENNATVWLRVVAGKDGRLRIRDNFAGRTPQWSLPGVKKNGDNFEIALKKGEPIEATLPRPAAIPEAPTNLAEPVVVSYRR
jgi:alpha-L-fucosidase 2